MPYLFLIFFRITAFSLLLWSLLLPWLRVPVGVSEKLKGSWTVDFSEPISTIAFKGFVLVVVLFTSWLSYRRNRSGSLSWTTPLVAGGSLLLSVLVIAYPALTMQRCAAISARAGWLQVQNYSLTLPTGDAYRAQEYAHGQGQLLVNVAEVLPRAFEAMPTPVAVNSFSDLRLSRLEEVLMWIGLSPAFDQFIYRGWFCGLFGSFFLVLSFSRKGRGSALFLPMVPLLLVCGTFLLCFLCLFPVVMAGRELLKAQTALGDERLRESLHHLDLMKAWVPVLAYNTDVVYQRAWMENKLGYSSEAAELFSAMREEEEGFGFRAAEHYMEALKEKSGGPIWGETYRGALRLGIEDFNAGLIDRAARRFEQLEAIDPTCVKANYALQLAYLRTSRKEELECEVARFVALYGCFQSLEKSGLIASAHRRMAELDFDYRDVPNLQSEMRAAISP